MEPGREDREHPHDDGRHHAWLTCLNGTRP